MVDEVGRDKDIVKNADSVLLAIVDILFFSFVGICSTRLITTGPFFCMRCRLFLHWLLLFNNLVSTTTALLHLNQDLSASSANETS